MKRQAQTLARSANLAKARSRALPLLSNQVIPEFLLDRTPLPSNAREIPQALLQAGGAGDKSGPPGAAWKRPETGSPTPVNDFPVQNCQHDPGLVDFCGV